MCQTLRRNVIGHPFIWQSSDRSNIFAQKRDWSFIFWAEQREVNYFAQKCDWF
jgi:hypothetical protein